MNQEALNVLEYNNVKDMLGNEASTKVGRELIDSLMPYDNVSDAYRALSETDEAARIIISATPPFGGAMDIRPSLRKANIGMILDLDELAAVMSTFYALRELKKFFKELEIEAPILKSLAHNIEILGELERDLNNAIDEHGALRDDATVELSRLRREIKVSQRRIKESLSHVLHSAENQKYFQESIVTMRENRYVIPVKAEYRSKIPGIVHDQSSTGATVFIEPMAVVELNNDIKTLELKEEQEIARIMQRLTASIVKSSDAISSNMDILSKIDFTVAKAKLAYEMHASRPIVNDDGLTMLKNARHPLIPVEKVVPINITLGKDYRMMLITGPNTGGKTVSMKTLGLVSLMAASGLFIPADSDSSVAIYKELYVDIGDEQSIEQSLSTFSAHMKRIVSILSSVTSGDLVLLDEIGAGTDPEEGAALAMAILERLHNMRVSTVVTTHYSELKTFAYERDGIENACVEFDVETLRPTYRLLTGIPGASNAFAISSRLGLGDEMIERARELIAADHAKFETIVNGLEREKSSYEKMNDELLLKKREIDELEQKLQKAREELSRRKHEIIENAKRDGAEIVRRARRESEGIIRELKEQFNDKGIKKRQEAIRDSRARLSDLAGGVRPRLGGDGEEHGELIDLEKLGTGDTVYVISLGQKGKVEAIEGKSIVVDFGAMRTSVKADNCRFVAKKSKSADSMQGKATGTLLNKMKNVRREADIRGMMVDEGESVVAKFIDDAILAGLKEVLVIHGKGTGALRRGIHDYLRRDKNVRDFRFADIDEGGTGATLVTLKK